MICVMITSSIKSSDFKNSQYLSEDKLLASPVMICVHMLDAVALLKHVPNWGYVRDSLAYVDAHRTQALNLKNHI